jgi:hypothetical protein
MIVPVSVAEKLLFSTVRIETTLTNGSTGVGTGFFFDIQLDDQRVVPVIITNKHVIANSSSGQFQVHEAETSNDQVRPSGEFFTIRLDRFLDRWISHPNTEVDLCAMPFQPLRAEAEKIGRTIFSIPLSNGVILTDKALTEFSAVEDVLMIGYPIGLWDVANNLPILRRGITASHPGIDFDGKSIGVIDAACFPGSSGSPVLIVSEGAHANKAGALVFSGPRVVLLGVLFSGPQMTAEGEIIVENIQQIGMVSAQLERFSN